MKIALIAAMGKELALLLPLIEDLYTVKTEGVEYHIGRIATHDIVAVQSGIGKVNAALTTRAVIKEFRPDMVINTGVAGGVGRTKVLDVIIPSTVAYHDVWCGPGTVWGEAAGCPREFVCLPDDVTVKKLGAKRGLLASGDIFVSSAEEVNRIISLYPDAVAVDMESAAIAQTCYINNVPFACIRVVSDTPGSDDNISQYETFWEDAPRATFSTLTSLLKIIHLA